MLSCPAITFTVFALQAAKKLEVISKHRVCNFISTVVIVLKKFKLIKSYLLNNVLIVTKNNHKKAR
jgi:hypothetical protein